MSNPRTPDHRRSSFARTNARTISQRVALLREFAPDVRSVAEVCGGDCLAQAEAYRAAFGIERFLAVDLDSTIAAADRERGLEVLCADALDPVAMRALLAFDVVFFGPPLSEDCDGHRLLPFDEVRPSFRDFTKLLLGTLAYRGLLVCIGPRSTTMGDVQKLHRHVQTLRPDIGLAMLHYSVSTLTGHGEPTEPRRKYVELWFSPRHGDQWTVRESVD